jgi:pilus assembly protein CpaC
MVVKLVAVVVLAFLWAPVGILAQIVGQTVPLSLGSPTNETKAFELVLGKAELIQLPVKVSDVIVADPNVADVVVRSPQLVNILGRQIGVTNMVFLDEDQKVIHSLRILVTQDLEELRRALETLFPNENVKVAGVQQNIVLTGNVRSAQSLNDIQALVSRFVPAPEYLINQMAVRGDQQVMLRVRIAEVRRSIVKQLGISGVIGESDAVTSIGGGLVTPLTAGGVTGLIDQTNQIRFGLFPGSPFHNVALALDVLEQEGLVRTLAEPNLTALSGEGASFLAGGEIPVPTGVDQNGNIVIEFRDFGVSLEFRPTVLATGRINLHVTTEVSQIDSTNAITLLGAVIPGFTTRRVETTVELPSGGALAIGGLLENKFNNIVSGVPGLTDIPILGALFRSTNFQQDETELIVTVTIYLVRPVDDREIVLPGDGFAAASDSEMYLLGRLHARYGRPGSERPHGSLHGPIGFITE